MGEYKIKRYTKEDIDLFIGADLNNRDIYILPIDYIQNYTTTIHLIKCQQYKNNFNQLEPIIGNNNSGDDDNVEPLTGKADGNDVGTDYSGRERVDNHPPK